MSNVHPVHDATGPAARPVPRVVTIIQVNIGASKTNWLELRQTLAENNWHPMILAIQEPYRIKSLTYPTLPGIVRYEPKAKPHARVLTYISSDIPAMRMDY